MLFVFGVFAMNYWIVCDLPILCLIIELYLYFRMCFNRDDEQEIIILKRVLLFASLFTCMDLALTMLELNMIHMPFACIYIVNIVYNLAALIMLSEFFYYSLIVFAINTERKKNRLNALSRKVNLFEKFFHVFTGAVILLYIGLFKTDLFLISEPSSTPIYDYGILDYLWYVIDYMPVVVTFILALQFFFNKKHYVERERILPIICFCILIALGAVAQLVVNDSYPIVPMGVTLAMVYLFINYTEVKISQDVLTQTDNRRQCFRDLHALSERNSSIKWYLILLDGDEFKKINDGFGHGEGDEALRKIADILKISCRRQNAKLYRLGGDEFVILKETEGTTAEECDKEIEEFCRKIRNRFNEYNVSSGKMYKLMVSIDLR